MKIRTSADLDFEQRAEQFLLTLPEVVFASARWQPEEELLDVIVGVARRHIPTRLRVIDMTLHSMIGDRLGYDYKLRILGGTAKEELDSVLEGHQQASVS